MDLDFYVKPIEIEHLVNYVRAELSSTKILERPKNLFCDGIRLNKVQQERLVYWIDKQGKDDLNVNLKPLTFGLKVN